LKSDTPVRTHFVLPAKPNVSDLLNLATTLDAYRNFIFTKLDSFDKDITARKYGPDVLAAWKETHPSLQRIEKAGRSIPGIEVIWKLRSGSLVGGMALVMLAMVSIGLRMSALIFFGSFYCALIALAVSGATSYLSNRRMSSYIREYRNQYASDLAQIKDFVQRVLNSLSRYFRASKIDPTRHPFNLYNSDYKSIRVEKKPGLRRSYEVIIEAN
jgi:hypothetical protein